MDLTKADKARLARAGKNYRSAQERARSALLAMAQELIDAKVPAAQIADAAGMTRQQLYHLRQEAKPDGE